MTVRPAVFNGLVLRPQLKYLDKSPRDNSTGTGDILPRRYIVSNEIVTFLLIAPQRHSSCSMLLMYVRTSRVNKCTT